RAVPLQVTELDRSRARAVEDDPHLVAGKRSNRIADSRIVGDAAAKARAVDLAHQIDVRQPMMARLLGERRRLRRNVGDHPHEHPRGDLDLDELADGEAGAVQAVGAGADKTDTPPRAADRMDMSERSRRGRLVSLSNAAGRLLAPLIVRR